MTTYLLLLLVPFFMCNICTPNVAKASHPTARRKHISRVFRPEDCIEEECLESNRPPQTKLELLLLLNRLNKEDCISDPLTMAKGVPFLPEEEEVFAHTDSIPCFCHSRTFKSRDLGPKYYPRYLSEKTCDNSLCGGDSIYCCIPSYHTVLVLKNEASKEKKDGRIPGFMRAQWKFEEVNVTVTCVCQMNPFHR